MEVIKDKHKDFIHDYDRDKNSKNRIVEKNFIYTVVKPDVGLLYHKCFLKLRFCVYILN